MYFGSAIKGIGVGDLLDGLAEYGPPPRAQQADTRTVDASEPGLTALVFKIQANMDPNHRDRIAFARVCSGRLARGMRLKQVRTGKLIPLHAPQFFFAREREIADEAFAGDVVGIPNHGTLRIGDTLTDGEDINFVGVPYFAPEILRRVRLDDAMKAKKLRQALSELAEEGVVQLFRPQDGGAPLVGVVGTLQLDVLAARLAAEYGVGDRLRGVALRAGALGVVRRSRGVAEIHRREPQRDGRRCGRRSGVPRHLRLHDAARGGTGTGAGIPRHQGCARGKGGGLRVQAATRVIFVPSAAERSRSAPPVPARRSGSSPSRRCTARSARRRAAG